MEFRKEAIQAVVVFGGLGIFLMIKAFRRMGRWRKVADTPACPVSSMAAGFGEAQGVAWGHITYQDSHGYAAVYLQQFVEQYVSRGKSGSWVVRGKFLSHGGGDFFYLLDSSGLAKVFPEGAEENILENIRSWAKLSSSEKSLVLANVGGGVSPQTGLFSSSRWRVREKRIHQANPILVQGNFTPYGTPQVLCSPQISYVKKMLGKFLRPNARVTLPFDFDRNGTVDAKEMRLGIASLLAKALEFEKTAGVDNPAHNHALCGEFTRHSEHKLFLADTHQETLLKRLGSWNMLMFVLGACLLGAAAFFLFGRANPT